MTPLLAIVHLLQEAGWEFVDGEEPLRFTADSPRKINATNIEDRREFLLCLLELPRLLAEGTLELATDQTALYYKAVRMAANGVTVPVGKDAGFYRALLKDIGDQVGVDIETQTQLDAVELLTKGKRKRTDGGNAGATEAKALKQSPSPPPNAEAAASPAVQAGGAASSSGARDIRPMLPPPGTVLPLQGSGVTVSRFPARASAGEERYVRYLARCPLAGTGHCGTKPCAISRNAHSKQCRNFGQWEPLAFVGCWLRAASRFENREMHMLYKPLPNEVREYMLEHGWPIEPTL